jgi:hypothetical protein
MEATLTNSEMETIAKIVSEKLYAKFIADGSQKELQKATENYTKQMIDFYLKENAVAYDVAKMIKPIFDEHLKQTKIVEEQLRSYMNTEHFKKLELKHLKDRVNQIEGELYEDNEN